MRQYRPRTAESTRPHRRPISPLDKVPVLFFYPAMDKEAFLRLQYLRMLNAEDFVVEQWRRSVDRFLADMLQRTPNSVGRRFLAPVDPKLGFSPDNVEWQYPKVHVKPSNTKKSKAQPTPAKPVQARHSTKAERKQIELAAKDAKRAAIAAELAAWNNGLLVRSR